MSKYAVRELTHDTALDVLFQQSAEEQFEALRTMQERPDRGVTLMDSFRQWFRTQTQDPYPDYYAE
jgi:hypothetical protein